MNFECLLLSAKAGNEDAITTILQMYRPLLLKQSRKIQEAIVQRLVASSNTPVSLFFGVPTNQKAGKEPKEQSLQQLQKL